MTQQKHARQYHDVVLMPSLPRRKLSWLRRPKGRYYPTSTRHLSSGQVEVTFSLPPRVLRQWQAAIHDGKRIRLMVPN